MGVYFPALFTFEVMFLFPPISQLRLCSTVPANWAHLKYLFPPTGRSHIEYAGNQESEVRFPCSRQFIMGAAILEFPPSLVSPSPDPTNHRFYRKTPIFTPKITDFTENTGFDTPNHPKTLG
ncbi:hypothetical protein J6590_086659 [Homalodisca vitripennis]|nr:hypothetical protein J6590_086659 [Homalodisca vitripennis]